MEAFLKITFPNDSSLIYRDLSLNLKKTMEDSSLEPLECMMNVAAIARSLHWKELENLAAAKLLELGRSSEQVQECFEAAALNGMLNTYYKFKGYLSDDVAALYPRAGLRMNSLLQPVNGKVHFEMMAISVSIINGCPACISSHEKVLTNLGVSRDKIHDLARLAAVLKGLSCLK